MARFNIRKFIIFVMVIFLSSCTSGAISPTPTETLAAIPSLPPEKTPTSLPEMPTGPFLWSGLTRPLLMAHYMPWYQTQKVSGQWGWHWTMNHFTPAQGADGRWKDFASHYTPLTGPYDSSDPAVLEYQVQLMKLSGIDGVIVDWYGIENFWDYGSINASTGKLFQVIKKAGLKFVICYEDATVKNMVENNHIQAADAVAHGQEVMRYLQNTWFGDEAYLKIDNQPVLFTFGPQYYKTSDAWKSLFSAIDPKPLLITLDKSAQVGAIASYPWPPMSLSQGGVLSHDTLISYMADFYDRSENWKYHVGGAFPGFHDIYKEANVGSSYGFLDALDGKTFRLTLQEALNHNPDMIQLITWNDYGEGTIIEPTIEFEYRYLEMVQEARKVTSNNSFAFSTEDLRLPYQLYQLRQKYAADSAATADLNKAAGEVLDGNLEAAAEIIKKYP